MTKKVYQFDVENKIYKGELILDDSDKSPSGAWNIPGDCTETVPPTEKENYIPVWNGSAWVETEDYRGKEYWLPADTYGTPGREVKEIGPLPEGATLTPPEQTLEEKNQEFANAAKVKLENLAVSAMMAQLAGSDISAQQTEYQSNITVLSDDVAVLIPEVYPAWSANSVEYKVGDRVQYNGVLYKVLTAHTSQESWTPEAAPSLFVKVLTSDNEILDWEQPSADNAYMKGDKVRYNGKVYESLIDNNVWKPDEYPAGWKEVTETITIL